MTKLVNQMFCETHQCPISITGCMLRQKRNQDNPPAWMHNKIPGDPKCSDCAQGKAVMKKHKRLKTKLMSADDDTYEKNKRAAADRKETFMATDTTSLDNGHAGITPALEQEKNPNLKQELAASEHHSALVASGTKSCNRCELVCYLAEAESHFYASKHTKDGFETTCKECRKRMDRERREAKKASEKPGKPARSKKSKPKKNPEKAAAASPEKTVAEVVTPVAEPGNEGLADKEKKAFCTSGAVFLETELEKEMWKILEKMKSVINEKEGVAGNDTTDTIKENDHPVELDEMDHALKQLSKSLLASGHSNGIDLLIRHLFEEANRPHLYKALVKSAYIDMRPPHLQALYLIACALDPFGKGE